MELTAWLPSPNLVPCTEARMAEEARDEGGGKAWLDFPGFAQEFLRRGPEYRRDYESVMSDPEGDPTAQEVMARRWGLCFPGRSPSVGA